MKMNARKFTPLLMLAPMLVFSVPSWSQPGGAPKMGDRPSGGWGGRPGMGGGMRGMRNSPKFKLTRWIEGIGKLEASPKVSLNKGQAKKIVSIVSPWKSKKTMSDKDAGNLYAKLSNVPTPAQKQAIDKMNPRRMGGGPGDGGGRPGGGGPGGPGGDRRGGGGFGGGPGGGRPGGGPGGPGGGMGQGMEAMRTYMETVNPLASPKLNPGFAKLPDRMKERMLDRFKEENAVLSKLAQKAK